MLRGCTFARCDLSGADLGQLRASGCAFLSCRFTRTRLFEALLRDCKLTGWTFEGAELRTLRVKAGDWSYVTLRGEDLRGVSLAGLRLVEADLSGRTCAGRTCPVPT